ncbi:putative nucleoside-diphosphate-sugar epimerase [Xylariaceae sp. FL0016]|nr:putative nucleoside-diphosphate-sugar epimerase [Xylariaceae sp. FL0016]
MHLILTGATGMVGSGVLDAMIKMKDVTKISILSRRVPKMIEGNKDPRINVIVHNDFNKYEPSVLAQLQGAQGCVWALGISQTQVSKEEYVKITKDYALEASKAFQSLPPPNEPFHFVYVSGMGATTNPGAFSAIFARVKGETELALADMRRQNPLFRASSVRPAGVDATDHAAIQPYVPALPLARRIFNTPMLATMRLAFRQYVSPTEDLGRFLTEMAMGKPKIDASAKDVQMVGEFPIVENAAFRRAMGLSS